MQKCRQYCAPGVFWGYPFFGLLWSPTLWFYIITLQCTVCYVVWLPAGDDQMEFSWMWYLNCILDGCYYPRVIGHFKKLYFDQQVYLAVTAFHGGIPPNKNCNQFFCNHIKFEFCNCNVDPLYACRKCFKRSCKSSFFTASK